VPFSVLAVIKKGFEKNIVIKQAFMVHFLAFRVFLLILAKPHIKKMALLSSVTTGFTTFYTIIILGERIGLGL
jgi:hypothetical protein